MALEDAEVVKEPEVDTAGEEEVEEEAGDGLPFPVQKEEEEDEHVPTDDRQQQIDDGTLAGPVPSETVVRTELSAQEPPIRKVTLSVKAVFRSTSTPVPSTVPILSTICRGPSE